jgi:hypothetical protein
MCKKMDIFTFFCSFTFTVIFNIVYWIILWISLHQWESMIIYFLYVSLKLWKYIKNILMSHKLIA